MVQKILVLLLVLNGVKNHSKLVKVMTPLGLQALMPIRDSILAHTALKALALNQPVKTTVITLVFILTLKRI